MSTFNLISNITNGAGLQKDTELMASILEKAGHKVSRTMFNATVPTYRHHDINIFLEVVAAEHFRYAKESWLVPNSEWWYQGWESLVPRFSKVLCKTHDCWEIWRRKVGEQRAVYMGFQSNDFYKPEYTRVPTFLHLAGKSETKNTAAVMAAWRNYNIPYPLLVSAFKPEIVKLCRGVQNVRQVDRLTPEETIRALNECQFHIMPSKYEGYGHAIHEALGCRGVVLTTDAPPMNEFGGIWKPLLIPSCGRKPRPPLTWFHEVDPAAIRQVVYKAAQLTTTELQVIGDHARAGFLSDQNFFLNKIQEIIK